jgi:FkbM family methyltransferase
MESRLVVAAHGALRGAKAEVHLIVSMLSVKQKIFIARQLNRGIHLFRAIFGLGMHVRCRRGGILWNLDLDEGIDLSIYLLGAYEPQMLRAYTALIRPGDTVFDIGANIGAHTLHFGRLAGPDGRVFAFEPTDFAFGKLRRNLESNPKCAAVVTANQAFLVATLSTPLPTGVYSSWPVSAGVDDLHAEHLGKAMSLADAKAFTADEYCETLQIARIDLVKLDVDGHELSVLQGFRKSLARFKPRILIEIAPFVYDETSPEAFDEIVAFLSDLGYEFFDAYNGKPVPADAARLRAMLPPGGSMNALLRPRA